MNPIPEIVQIRQKREALGISQFTLGRLSGVTESNIAKLECGENQNPKIDTLTKLRDGLKRAAAVPVLERMRLTRKGGRSL